MLHKIGGCFLRLPEENGEQRAPKAEIVGAASFLVNAASSHLASIYLGQLGSTTSPCERGGPITAALGRTECQKMFGGAVICIKGRSGWGDKVTAG